jgi:NAD(P)-dependent dehydrogenase (short-subunit alcohol dehydrogenase family)
VSLRFDGRAVVVTGAGGAIGSATATLLAERGALVVANDLGCDLTGKGQSSEPSEAVVEQIRSRGGVAVPNWDTVASPEGAQRVVACALEEFGRLDALVNIAGNFIFAPLLEHSVSDVCALLDTHLVGTYLLTKEAWPHLKAAPSGRIVNTASGAAVGLQGLCGYASAKGAVIGFTRSVALEAAQVGIGVNAILPTSASRMVDVALGIGDNTGARRITDSLAPAAVAPVVAFLAHERCKLSGELLTAAGGRVGRMTFIETKGFRDEHLTAESVEEHLTEILDPTDSRLLSSNDDRW